MVARRLGSALWPVEPLCLAEPGSGMHRALRAYKAAPALATRAAASLALSGLLGAWLGHHTDCLARGAVGARRGGQEPSSPGAPLVVVPVPSSAGGRASWEGRHPLVECCERAIARAGTRLELAPVLRATADPPRRLEPTSDGFEPVVDLGGAAVLVVDDLFVSGSRSMSAAAALAARGATVRAVVPLARLVRPDHNAVSAAFWQAASRVPADLASCTRCSGAPGRTARGALARSAGALGRSLMRASARSGPWPRLDEAA